MPERSRENRPKRVLLCSCDDSFPLDDALIRALEKLGLAPSRHHRLCRDEAALASEALARAANGEAPAPMICCTQEAPLFTELAEEAGLAEPPTFVNLREMAGWSAQAAEAGPKMAALVAAAQVPAAPQPLTEFTLAGRCLVTGPAEQALALAEVLADDLSVSVLITEGAEEALPPMQERFIVRRGRLAALGGRIGAFRARLEEAAPMLPWSREALLFSDTAQTVEETYDIVIEIGTGPARFTPHGREGYFHARPEQEARLNEIALQASRLVGTFEKPLFVRYEAARCAHARNGIEGCRRCLGACPTRAITADGDGVRVDVIACEGCGDCAAVCPSGALAYMAPLRNDFLKRAHAMLRTYIEVGGERPVLLVHEEKHGGELLAMLARFGDGQPANVLPLALHSIAAVGHAWLVALAAMGYARVVLLAPRHKLAELEPLQGEVALTGALLRAVGRDANTARLVTVADPFELAEALAKLNGEALTTPERVVAPPAGNRRELVRLSMERLAAQAENVPEVVALPAGAPYGAVTVDGERCTLCMSCVGACPAGALGHNPERPQLRFVETACLQCGLCARTCPEDAITLSPRWNFRPEAAEWVVLAEDEPAVCPACGKAFGSKKAVESVIARLAGVNPMFASAEDQALLRYCEDCRVIALTQRERDPFAMNPGRRPRTTEDYLKEEKE